ncbi:MAG TPA: hypothetical protein VJY35_09355 [Candidatus Eisenbacteria bacterium]|nr:hypothetical protein [Candidatus Eisenbacteria bacterium]
MAHPQLERRVGHGGADLLPSPQLLPAKSKGTKPRRHVAVRVFFPLGARSRPALFALVAHELGAEGALRFVLVMRPAAQPQVIDGRLASARDFQDVVELQHASRLASVARFAHVRAPLAVTLQHRPFHVGRDVARVGRHPPPRARLRGDAELLFLELTFERLQRAFEDLPDIV